MAQSSSIFHHILVPTDGSDSSIEAGKLAVEMAACNGARLTMIYVVDDDVVSELANNSESDTDEVRSDLERSGRRHLNYLSRFAKEAGLTADQTIRYGKPYDQITDAARELEVDLIVIGKVGSRGLRRILIGSVTERVIEHAPCSVFVVK